MSPTRAFPGLIAALWPAIARGQAAGPASETPGPPTVPETPTGTVTAVAPTPVVGIDVDGTLLDPREQILALARSAVPPGTPYLEAGPADRLVAPVGTIPRLRAVLDRAGYHAVVEPAPAPGGVRMVIHLVPFDRVRRIFVAGNWPIRQDEIQKRFSLRPGQPLPLPGPERAEAIERERGRLVDFLRAEGYLDANARIDVATDKSAPSAVDVLITLALGQGFPIGAITTTGNNALPASDIAAELRHRTILAKPWRWSWSLFPAPAPFQMRALRQDLAELTLRYHQLGYPGAHVTSDYDPTKSVDHQRKEVDIGVVVNEHKHVSVAFEGNERRSSSTLRGELTLFDQGGTDDYALGAAGDALHRSYQSQGYFLARVRWRRERVLPDEDRVVYTIDEGPRLKVRGVDFAGNRALEADELRDVVSVKEFPLLGFLGLGAGGYATGRQIDLDTERLVDHYRGKGFLDARARGEAATSRAALGLPGTVAASAETADRDARSLYVRYTIEEGPQVRVGAVTFRSENGAALPYGDDFLRRNLRLREGEPYRVGPVKEDTTRIERLLGDAGFPAPSVVPDVERAGDRVAIRWRIDPGVRTRVGPILLRGNFLTRPDAILEWVPLRPGDLLTTTAFERSQRNLQLIQVFNSVKIDFPGQEEKRPEVPMVITVEERHDHYGVVRFGAGGSTEQVCPNSDIPLGGYFRVDYEHRNFVGRGWNLLTQATYGQCVARAGAQFQDRRFLGTLFRLEVNASYLSQATVRLGDLRTGAGSIGFAREMFPGVDAALRYNLRNTTRTEPLLRGPGASETDATATLSTTVGSVSLAAEWLRLDNRLLPTRGFKLDGAVEYARPDLSFGFGADSFVKVSAREVAVMPLGSRLSVRQGIRYDQGFPLRGASVLPKPERYFAGGDTTIRGFELDRARSETIRFPIAPGVDSVLYRPLGGSLRVLHNVDLQFPIAPPLYGSLFMDNGVVADSFDGLGATAFRHGVGVAPILIKLPIGDIQFAWAWPLDAQPGDTKIGRFHVNIGLMF